MSELKQKLFYHKLANDPHWYIQNFLKIRNKNSKLVPFQFNSAQLILNERLRHCEKNKIPKKFIILKARQMGISTWSEGQIFARTASRPFVNSLIIAHEDTATQNLFNMSKLYYEELPNEIRPMKKYSNEKALSFENPTNDDIEKQSNPGLRSKITVATAGSKEAGRSATINNLHISELAFFPNPEITMLALMQSVPDNLDSMVLIESTANGVGDYFHRMWKQAERGESEFIPIFLPWFTEPNYMKEFSTDLEKEQFRREVDMVTKDSAGKEIFTEEKNLMEKHDLTLEQLHWRKYTIANKCNGDLERFQQEYPSTPEEAFIASGRPKFNVGTLKKYQSKTKKGERGYLEYKSDKVVFIPDSKGYLEVWEHPQQGVNYCIGADVAEGLIHGDYSVAFVGTEEFTLPCMWHGHIDPDLFGDELVKLAKYYNDAYLGIENNNHGLTTIRRVQYLEYWNIYYQKTYDMMTDKMSQKVGWHTNRKTKPMMINKLAEFVRDMTINIPSDLLISEMYTYIINENGTTDAQQGCHDDTVMSVAILLQLLLEGRGDDYLPEVPTDKKRFRDREIIDPLFEKKEIEVSE